ncbi:Vacuolar protein sorting-associated protein VTA1 [Neolecta irregularis DAH-3]|uniref:Vacuolar protein sorting-associated protein VTA1 n=1 Tax=Neolecta irregularis (strain DAH-3) TaxID=1198029 RepID=A0A1U7LIL3_NEOID|nr:Vacuolar protein sorting-associated protein VTA1 [Neolecta irregularis DAH-3]|eukprot:OLL22506.1 Vacuolar protein sorting-associated protein VTA1 [Neolecta irregularis DAH-3]
MKLDIPDELGRISQYLQRSNETAQHDQIISYYCKYRAAQLAMAAQHRSPAANSYLSKLLDDLENARFKKELNDQDAIKDDIVGQAYVENFALSIFSKADREERGARATRNTSQTFLAAATFLEVCRVFGDLESEISEKIKYAKYQAARILKAVKAGLDPNEERRADSHVNDEIQSSVAEKAFSPVTTRQETPNEDFIKPEKEFNIEKFNIEKAQKHARWAISALNYEDMSTAIEELQKALRELGA